VLKLLENNEEQRLRKMIQQIVQRNSDKLVSWKNMQHLINALYYTGQRKAVNNNNELFTKIRLISDLDERINVILDSYHRIIDDASPLRDGDSMIISAIRKYVSENYSENISLQTVAEKTNYSAKYVSRLFKEHTGYNLSDYINMYRVLKAKEKMRQTNMSIGEIQDAVGIPSRTTFIRVFKKFEGITPSKFRELELLTILFDETKEKEDQ
jgi:YesN/AraC family two-component response regulator